MHVVVSGSSGLVGGALVPLLRARGHRVTRLVRRAPAGEGAATWDPDKGALDPATLEGVDAVVHLGGVSIAGGVWTPGRKRRILESRVGSTSLLARTMAGAARRPSVFVHSSGSNYYGDRGDEILSESSPPGHGFLADVCRAWEEASRPAMDAGVRVVHLRTGLVMSARGGVLAALAPIFRLGLGGRVGSGRQWMPWIALDDLTLAIARAVEDASLRGAVNAVAPEPATNADFTRALGRALRRPTSFPVPAFLVRLLPGGMGEETLLGSQRIVPARLLSAGFAFRHPSLEETLAALFG
ncbi:MAG: TIGR01777 family oxidoreductase [Hyphomicrobiales bacterium]